MPFVVSFVLFSCQLVGLELGRLYFLPPPLSSPPTPLLSPASTPAFANLYFRRLDSCRRVPPGVAGGRRAPPSKIVVFHRFFVHWRPKIVKNRCFFNVFRTKSLKIVENRCFSIVFRTNSSKIIENRCFSIVFRTNSSKIVENRCFSIVFRTFSFQHR